MARMNPEVKAKWVAALRSMTYRQGTGVLRDGDNRYCCLGVLCDIKDSRGWLGENEQFSYDYGNPGADDIPPSYVGTWAGLEWETEVEIDGKTMTLYDHNDAGRTFQQIADAIEAQL